MAPGWPSPPAPEALSESASTNPTTSAALHSSANSSRRAAAPSAAAAAAVAVTPTPPSASTAAYHLQFHPLPGPSLPPASSSSDLLPAPLPPASASSSLVLRIPLPQDAAPPVKSPRHPRPSSSSASDSYSSGGDSPTVDPAISGAHASAPLKNRPLPLRSPSISSSSFVPDGQDVFVPRSLKNRFTPRGGPSASRLRIDTSASYVSAGDEEDDDEDNDLEYSSQFTNDTPLHSRLFSEPFIPVLRPPPSATKRATTMALHPPENNRPPPLRIDSFTRSMSGSMPVDPKHPQPKTPGHKISSFFGWRQASSPGGESSSTDISENGRSPLASPMPPSLPSGTYSITPSTTVPFDNSFKAYPPRNPSLSSAGVLESTSAAQVAELENELREISSELAGSIRREMELEDLIERLQSEMPMDNTNKRTSDYFSDSGTSSIRNAYDGRADDVEKFRRAAEQERAQIKVELTQKWQEERSRRAATESHIQILETQVHQLRRERTEFSDFSSKIKELESTLEDTRRKLAEERQIKDNFEDLLTAMRVELEQLRNERDSLRDMKGGGGGSSDPSEVQRLFEEIEALKIENASLAQLHGTRFASIDGSSPRGSGLGLSRSNSLARKPTGPSGLSRSGSLSRSNSVSAKDTRESLADRVEGVEAQRDALHGALKRLLDRQAHEARQLHKRSQIMERELFLAQQSGSPRKLGYEREVRNLREEVNHLRQRAEEALEQKWQCEKGLAGLKMDLDRAEQETTSLRVLLQELDINLPTNLEADKEGFAEVEATSSSLESAYRQLQADREHAEASVAQSPQDENSPLATTVSRTETLAHHVQRQLAANNTLRTRLADAIGKGEQEQQVSATQINAMQSRLKELEDALVTAQQHSEDEMARHEEEIRNLQDNHNDQLMRMRNGARSPAALSPMPPQSPFGARSPRLDKTTSGDGIPLEKAIQSENLERRVKELEKLLRDADAEMEKVVSRMNRAQIDVAELQSDRDEALRQTRRLQAEIQTERDMFKSLMG